MMMRTVLLAVLCGASANAQIRSIRGVDHVTYEVKLERPTFPSFYEEGSSFSRIRISGAETWLAQEGKVGEPALPTLRFFVEGEGSITVQAGTRRWERLSAPLEPILKSVKRSQSARARHRIDPNAYAKDYVSPPGAFEVAVVGLKRGVLVRQVTLHPIAYRPKSGQIGWVDGFQVSVPGSLLLVPTLTPVTFGFIVGSSFAASPALAKLIAFKESLGYRVKVSVLGKDTAADADAIRRQLQTWYGAKEAPLRYVILVGDNDAVPGKEIKRAPHYTDHYFRALDDPYESDIGTPDVGVGRFSASSETELAVLVDKQIRYERGDFAAPDWTKRWSFIGTDDTGPGHTEMVEDTHNWAISLFTKPLGFLGSFPKSPEAGGDRLYAISEKATSADVLRALQDGRGFVNYGGHGDTDSWLGPHFSQAQVLSLSHPDALPFISSQACNTGDFAHDSFAETWHRHAKGAIAFWGSIDSLFWDPADDRIGRSEYEILFKQNRRTFEELVHGSISEGWKFLGGTGKSVYYWETYVLLGDPATWLRTAPPRPTQIKVAPLAAGSTEIRAEALTGGAPWVASRIGATRLGGLWRDAVLAGVLGQAVLTLDRPAQSGDTYVITASGGDNRLSESVVRVP